MTNENTEAEWLVTMEESPYGDTGVTYEGTFGMINHFILQLEHFRAQPTQTPEGLQAIDIDIAGYKEILKSGKKENADKFLELKTNGKRGIGKEFDNNWEVVNYMKENNLWNCTKP